MLHAFVKACCQLSIHCLVATEEVVLPCAHQQSVANSCMALQVSTVDGVQRAEQCELSQAAAQAVSSLQKQVVTMGMADGPGCHQF